MFLNLSGKRPNWPQAIQRALSIACRIPLLENKAKIGNALERSKCGRFVPGGLCLRECWRCQSNAGGSRQMRETWEHWCILKNMLQEFHVPYPQSALCPIGLFMAHPTSSLKIYTYSRQMWKRLKLGWQCHLQLTDSVSVCWCWERCPWSLYT